MKYALEGKKFAKAWQVTHTNRHIVKASFLPWATQQSEELI